MNSEDMMFKFDNDEAFKMQVWLTEHNEKCKLREGKNTGAIGGRISYTFTPTSLGIIKKVSCACGESICVNDFENW